MRGFEGPGIGSKDALATLMPRRLNAFIHTASYLFAAFLKSTQDDCIKEGLSSYSSPFMMSTIIMDILSFKADDSQQ